MELGNAFTAFWWGIISAVSLPLGALLGLWIRPSNKWTSSLMSFGAGALLAALTLELVAESLHTAGFWPLGFGCVAGALLFMGLNGMLNGHGGFLRKLSTTVSHLTHVKRRRAESLLEKCSRIALLRALPPGEMQALLPALRRASFPKGATIFRKGDKGDRLYLLDSGEVEIVRGHRQGDTKIARLGEGDAFGEMALLTGEPRTATVRAMQDVTAWVLDKEHFDRLLVVSPALKSAVTDLTRKRREALERLAADDSEAASRTWANVAKASISHASVSPTPADIVEAHSEAGGGAALAIWLGILLDGIPESLVIGGSMIGSGTVSLSLIAGVFLANFPEALSSAVGMKQQGYTTAKIVWMWLSLAILTGIGAFIGNLTFGYLTPTIAVFVGGLAAGAMLAMIAETMLPEAAEQRGPANGLMTVLGFLAAVFVGTFKTGGH
ncbi:MAG: cyclic nucleotide-binding domain-containing protein [Elusimicrobiota bacterium]